MVTIYRKRLSSLKLNRPETFQFITSGTDFGSGPIIYRSVIYGTNDDVEVSYYATVVPASGSYSNLSLDGTLGLASIGVFVPNGSGVDAVTISRSRSWKNDYLLIYSGLPNFTYVDVGYPLNTEENYVVRYLDENGAEVFESDELSGTAIERDDWLMVSGGGTVPYGHDITYAWVASTGARYIRTIQTETFDVFGTSFQKVSRGNVLGRDGVLEIICATEDRRELLGKIKGWMDNTTNMCVKTPYGDSVFVSIGEPSIDWIAIGHVKVSIPYIEIDSVLGGLISE